MFSHRMHWSTQCGGPGCTLCTVCCLTRRLQLGIWRCWEDPLLALGIWRHMERAVTTASCSSMCACSVRSCAAPTARRPAYLPPRLDFKKARHLKHKIKTVNDPGYRSVTFILKRMWKNVWRKKDFKAQIFHAGLTFPNIAFFSQGLLTFVGLMWPDAI